MRVPAKEEIIASAKRNGGFYTVNRNNYSADKLREKLKNMGKDTKSPLNFYSITQTEIIYTL